MSSLATIAIPGCCAEGEEAAFALACSPRFRGPLEEIELCQLGVLSPRVVLLWRDSTGGLYFLPGLGHPCMSAASCGRVYLTCHYLRRQENRWVRRENSVHLDQLGSRS
jgi:hypothetical protein